MVARRIDAHEDELHRLVLASGTFHEEDCLVLTTLGALRVPRTLQSRIVNHIRRVHVELLAFVFL